MSKIIGKIIKVSGPLIIADGMRSARMFDVVYVSDMHLIGEIIELRGDLASVQVYEETSGLCAGDPVFSSGAPLSVELAPGLMESIFDGIGRPLVALKELTGERIGRGAHVDALDRKKKWRFTAKAKTGDEVRTGDILGTVQENEVIEHRILVPHGVKGKISHIKDGEFTITDTIAKIEDKDITMLTKWPVRKGRPYKNKLTPVSPLITGQRVIDTFFPIAKGGVAAIPGPFGSGKTVIQHQLAKWADADIVVYIGCGERGNEMTDVLNEFPKLLDAKNNQPLMKRTILIANTSDMPVAAREASIYTGITIAEYFRDQGYNVAIMADSTSRWAEALREMSGRLEEMPGEEGYPAYLASRLAEFYERAGVVEVLGSNKQTGSITAIGAVSPPGGDLSEPVSQGTLRIVKVFWGLSASLAYKRHLPAIDWLISYSLYADKMSDWYSENISPEFLNLRGTAIKILQEDASLEEIARLVGIDSLSDKEKLTMETARSIREDFLQQNAFNEIDTFSSLKKQYKILKIILGYHNSASAALDKGGDFYDLLVPAIKEKIARFKLLPEDDLEVIDKLMLEIGGGL
ncbi:v-type proton atpase catalytic subunit a [Holotrichia oblita]|nr:v-type proton atpase catalytic subunit a [Holotrichia oblita]